MSERVHDFEQVSVYGLDVEPREELLRTHAECTFNGSTKDGWPVGVMYPDPKTAEGFAIFLDSPLRVVLEVVSEKWITYDGAKMFLDSAGKLRPELRTEPKTSDTVRLRRELEKRDLA